MNNKELRLSIQKFLKENYDDLGIYSDFDSQEMMGAAKSAAMTDIMSSGEDFTDLGNNAFEKDLDINSMVADLEKAKKGKSGNQLNSIQKQLNHLKKFGAGSLNEENEEPTYAFDTKTLYHFLQDAFYQLKDLDEAASAKILEKELIKYFDVNKKINNSKLNFNLNEEFIEGVNYDNVVASELKAVVGDLKRLTPYVLTIGDSVTSGLGDEITVSEDGKPVKKFKDVNAFLAGIGVRAMSLNEEGLNEYYFVDKYADDIEKRMDKTKPYTNKEFLDLFTQKHALQHSKVMDALKDELKNRGFNIETDIAEDSAVIRHQAGQRQKEVPLGQHATHSQVALKSEGDGMSLTVKKGMNIKPIKKK